jgi:hypothetical protein
MSYRFVNSSRPFVAHLSASAKHHRQRGTAYFVCCFLFPRPNTRDEGGAVTVPVGGLRKPSLQDARIWPRGPTRTLVSRSPGRGVSPRYDELLAVSAGPVSTARPVSFGGEEWKSWGPAPGAPRAALRAEAVGREKPQERAPEVAYCDLAQVLAVKRPACRARRRRLHGPRRCDLL